MVDSNRAEGIVTAEELRSIILKRQKTSRDKLVDSIEHHVQRASEYLRSGKNVYRINNWNEEINSGIREEFATVGIDAEYTRVENQRPGTRFTFSLDPEFHTPRKKTETSTEGSEAAETVQRVRALYDHAVRIPASQNITVSAAGVKDKISNILSM